MMELPIGLPIEDQFIYSCEQNDEEVLESCLTKNVDVNQVIRVDGVPMTGLELAFSKGSTAVFSRLLEVPGIKLAIKRINYEELSDGQAKCVWLHYVELAR